MANQHPGESPAQRKRLLGQSALCALVLLPLALLALALALAEPCVEPDFWSHLAIGRHIWETKTVPDHNPFTYVPSPKPWVNHTLVSGMLFFALFKEFGLKGLIAYRILLCFFTALVLYAAARKRGASRPASLAGLLLTALFFDTAFPPFLARSFTSVFLALFFYILEGSRQDKAPRRLFLLIPLTALWASLHFSVFAGLMVTGAYGLWDPYGGYKAGKGASPFPAPSKGSPLARLLLDAWRRYFVFFILLLCLMASLANPFGGHMWGNFVEDALITPQDVGGEWMRLAEALKTGFDFPFTYSFVCLLAATLLLIVLYLRKDRLAAFLLLLFAFIVFFTAIRMMVLFAICFAVFAPTAMDGLWRDLRGQRKTPWRTMGAGLAILCLVLVLAIEAYFLARRIPVLVQGRGLVDVQVNTSPVAGSLQNGYYPVGAARFMKQSRLSGKVLTHAIWGGYVVWQGYPRISVAVDGRVFEEYPRSVFNSYVRFFYGDCSREKPDFQSKTYTGEPGWRVFLERYPPDYVLVPASGRLEYLMRTLPGWEQIFRDASAALFARKRPESPARTEASGA